MRKWSLIALLLPLAALLTRQASAQEAGIRARLERPAIRVGEQVVLSLSAEAHDLGIVWPEFKDTLTSRIEVVKDNGVDTVKVGGNGASAALRLERRLTLTAFDTGYWAIPPMRFQIAGRIVESEALLLHVQGMEVPKGARPADIMPIHEAPMDPLLWLVDHWVWIAGIAFAGALAWALLLFLRRKRKVPETPLVEAPVLPLHMRILAEMDALERERLWQQGDHKIYQSRLTDLVRGYLEERYSVPALERTTDELMHELRVSPLSMEQQTVLGNMLRLADMVKFAKALPAPQENEQMIVSARRFVLETAETQLHEARA